MLVSLKCVVKKGQSVLCFTHFKISQRLKSMLWNSISKFLKFSIVQKNNNLSNFRSVSFIAKQVYAMKGMDW